MRLVIVESPTKAKHISHMLGDGTEVLASVGHIRDLPVKGDAAFVRPPNFALHYEISDKKKDVVAKLVRAAKGADEVFLATDPDREGEAIAWHLAQVLSLGRPKRISYQEVTETAIRKALASPRSLDMNLIGAQEARRGLDRMIGWEVSGTLSRFVGETASAGRVQTPALRLIVEREREIRAFRPVDHYGVVAYFPGDPGAWKANWVSGEEFFLDRGFASRLAEAVPGLSFRVTEAVRATKAQPPPPPFTTSTLQKTGAKSLSMGIEEVMKLAQSLFEQGLITYHRTDSPNLSQEGESMIREEAARRKIPLSEKPRRWKAKDGAQEAHEAIRPTDMSKDSAGGTEEERALYFLIWKRSMASQAADARFVVTTASFDAGSLEGKSLVFKASGSRLDFPGWKTVYNVEAEDGEDGDKEGGNPVPLLEKGETKKSSKGELKEKKTTPPARYTQSTLVDVLEKRGIGRPSTYASIVKTLFARTYIREEKKALAPTKLGESVVDALSGRFHFADIDYTKGIEALLDTVAEGKMDKLAVLRKAWDDLESNMSGMKSSASSSLPQHPCAECGKTLFLRKGKFGPFWTHEKEDESSCQKLFPDDNGKPGKPRAPKVSEGEGPVCPKCKKKNVQIFRASTGTTYFECPECRTRYSVRDGGELGEPWKKFTPSLGSGKSGTGKRTSSGRR